MPIQERQTPFKIDLNTKADPVAINRSLPRIMPSGERMVRKMLRDPYRGKTGFKYQGPTPTPLPPTPYLNISALPATRSKV